MPFEPEKITAEHIHAAINKIENDGTELNPSTGYDVIINGKPYPPKEVMRYAHEIANGENLWNLSGGPPTNKYLNALGFTIVDKKQNFTTSNGQYSPNGKIWKLGCNWGTGAPSFYNFIKNEKIVICKSDNLFNKGELVAIAEGHRIKAIARVSVEPRSVLENENFMAPFDMFQIDYEERVSYSAAEWYVLPEEQQFLYQLQQGICEIKQPEIKNKILELWNKRNQEKITNNIIVMNSKNTILYGPPGTGKTYNTINKAVSIASPLFDITSVSRADIKKEFTRIQTEGQIEFVTFHQSISYEDFVEGIKASTLDNKISYEVKPGIFKKLVTKAQSNWLDSQNKNEYNLSFEDAFAKLKELVEDQPDTKFKMKTEGKEFTITGFTSSSINFKKASGGTDHTLSISTLRDYYYKNKDIKATGVGVYYPGVLDKLKTLQPEESLKKEAKTYVLIIDEINRGNISQIFGELITLLEDDKRLGEKEELSITLPYSNEKLAVPPNLYIVGTMNTADRSVEALDTALRRRFTFEEMAPSPELLSPYHLLQRLWMKHWLAEENTIKWENWEKDEDALAEFCGMTINYQKYRALSNKFEKEGKQAEWMASDPKLLFEGVVTFGDGINLQSLLQTINARLKILVNKDSMIGHAWLMNVFNLSDLRNVFKNKVLPLLQEFFYNDYAKIGLILGRSFVQISRVENTSFATFDEELSADYLSKPIYTLKDPVELSLKDFQSIYK